MLLFLKIWVVENCQMIFQLSIAAQLFITEIVTKTIMNLVLQMHSTAQVSEIQCWLICNPLSRLSMGSPLLSIFQNIPHPFHFKASMGDQSPFMLYLSTFSCFPSLLIRPFESVFGSPGRSWNISPSQRQLIAA